MALYQLEILMKLLLVYTDVTLTHQQILKDINKIFDFFNINYRTYRYKHLYCITLVFDFIN
jgi:hypothetical protein